MKKERKRQMSRAGSETRAEGRDSSLPIPLPTPPSVGLESREEGQYKTKDHPFSSPNSASHPPIAELLNRASETISAEREKVATFHQAVSTLKKHLHQFIKLSVEDHLNYANYYRNYALSGNPKGYGYPPPSSTVVWGYLSSNAQILGELLYGSGLDLPKLDSEELGGSSSPPESEAERSRGERSPPLALPVRNGPGSSQPSYPLTRRLSGSLCRGDPLSSRENSFASPITLPNANRRGKKDDYAKESITAMPRERSFIHKPGSPKVVKPPFPSSPPVSQKEVQQVQSTQVHRDVVVNHEMKMSHINEDDPSKKNASSRSGVVATMDVSSGMNHEGDCSPPQPNSSSPNLSLSYPSCSDITPAEAGMIARLRRAVAPPPTKYQMDEVVEAMIGEMRKEIKEKLYSKTLDWPPVQKSLEKGTVYFYVPWTIQIEKENLCAYRFLAGPEESVNTVIDIRRKRPGCSVDLILLENQRARQDGQRVPKLEVKHFLVHLTIDSGRLSVVKGGGHTDLLTFLERKLHLRL